MSYPSASVVSAAVGLFLLPQNDSLTLYNLYVFLLLFWDRVLGSWPWIPYGAQAGLKLQILSSTSQILGLQGWFTMLLVFLSFFLFLSLSLPFFLLPFPSLLFSFLWYVVWYSMGGVVWCGMCVCVYACGVVYMCVWCDMWCGVVPVCVWGVVWYVVWCVHIYENQRLTLVFFSHFPLIFLTWNSLISLAWPATELQESTSFVSPAWWLQVSTTLPSLLCGHWALNSDPHTWVASTLLT